MASHIDQLPPALRAYLLLYDWPYNPTRPIFRDVLVYPANGDEPYIKKMEFSWEGTQGRPGLWPTGINLAKPYRGSLPSTHTQPIVIDCKSLNVNTPQEIDGEYSIYFNLDPRLPLNLNAARAAGIDPKLPGTLPTWRGDLFIGRDEFWLEGSLIFDREHRLFLDVSHPESLQIAIDRYLHTWYRSRGWEVVSLVDEMILKVHLDEDLRDRPEAIQARKLNGTDDLDSDRLHMMAKDAAAVQRLRKYEQRQSERIEKQGRCLRCNKLGQPKLMMCSQCRSAKYCSKECQRADWKFHKMICASLAEGVGDEE